jgi:hypothetical protein
VNKNKSHRNDAKFFGIFEGIKVNKNQNLEILFPACAIIAAAAV